MVPVVFLLSINVESVPSTDAASLRIVRSIYSAAKQTNKWIQIDVAIDGERVPARLAEENFLF